MSATQTSSRGHAWGKNKTLVSVVGLLADDRIPAHYFSDEWVGVCTTNDSTTVHHEEIYRWGNRHERPWCVEAEWVGTTTKMTTSFNALVEMNLCEKCWSGRGLDNALTANPGGYRDGAIEVLATLWRVWDLKRQITAHEARLNGEGKAPGPRATARLLGQAESGVRFALMMVQRKHADLADYAASLQEAAAGLRGACVDNSTQRQVLCEQIRDLSTPTWWEGEARQLDDSEAVMAVYPVPRLRGQLSVGKQAIRVFAISEDNTKGASKAVVRGPRYVLDYLARLSGDPSSTYCVIDEVGASEVMETAAALWEPAGGGPLSDWPVAVETAERLLAG